MSPAPDLHKDPIKKLIFKMTTPGMLAGLVVTSYSLLDMVFAAQLGSVEVASVAFIAPLVVMFQALASGVIKGGVSIIATLLGEKESAEASAYAIQLRLQIMVLSVFFCILGILLLPFILGLSGLSKELYIQSLIYSRILFLSIPMTLLFQLYQSFFRSQGKMAIISKISVFGIVCNALLNAFFIFWLDFKIDGLAYATLLTSVIQMLVAVCLYRRGTHDFTLGWQTPVGFSKRKIWRKLLIVGLPLSFSQASAHFGFMVLNIFIVQYGHQAVAAFAIGNSIHSLLFTPAREIGSGLIPLMAQNWGRGSVDRVKDTIRLGMIYTVVFGILSGIVIQIIKHPIAQFLTKDDQVTYQHIINYVSLVGWTVIAWAIFHTLQAIFTSFQKTMFTLIVDVVRLWGLRIPGIILFYTFIPSLAEYGIWNTMFISNAITALFAVVYFIRVIPPMLNQQQHNKSASIVNERTSPSV
ncbi:MATE family efflux transporter [Vibrio sp. JC009]|uniref:MATE family efflux transporter n=1 Tax=Vibrio sp. JC009 TaxID=2912314 RepID=UPI0023B032D8|nr:MATE family efflux transporter [Vibrio sp. JC009]WED23783.1 MATE family efflux transporter [Vibrio sp. JC009]